MDRLQSATYQTAFALIIRSPSEGTVVNIHEPFLNSVIRPRPFAPDFTGADLQGSTNCGLPGLRIYSYDDGTDYNGGCKCSHHCPCGWAQGWQSKLAIVSAAVPSAGVPAAVPSAGVSTAIPSAGVPAAIPSAGVPAAVPSADVPAAVPSADVPATIRGTSVSAVCARVTTVAAAIATTAIAGAPRASPFVSAHNAVGATVSTDAWTYTGS
jgi:hypothetical protein